LLIRVLFTITRPKRPKIKALAKEKARSSAEILRLDSSRALLKKTPLITGIAIINEKVNASFTLTPRLSKVTIVIPEREIPGKTANPCTKPKIKASLKVKSVILLFGIEDFEKKRIIPFINKKIATKTLLSK
jgi:hypothetical protein